LKFVIELAIDDVQFIHSHDLQRKKGGLINTGNSMKVTQGWLDGQQVAIKTLKDDRIPGWDDELNTTKKNEFRETIKNMIYEIRTMSHKTLRGNRNLVTLLAIGFEPAYINTNRSDNTGNTNLESFSPILVLPWALCDLSSLWDMGRVEQPNEAAEIVSDIADGLLALHKHDIIHCDIKPENILIFQDPVDERKLIAKIADFGGVASKQNDRYSIEGTKEWAAPECFHDTPKGLPDEHKRHPENEFNLARARDVFSFGLVAMYVALEGKIKGEWPDHRWNVQTRSKHLRKAVESHYHNKWPKHTGLMAKWLSLLEDTIVEEPKERMDSELLGRVRTRLLNRYFYHQNIACFR
jgi:serine/threonine protein kinase